MPTWRATANENVLQPMWEPSSVRAIVPVREEPPLRDRLPPSKLHSHELFIFTTADEEGVGSHGERIGDGGRREPWAICRLHRPTLPANSAAGVATKSHFHKRVTCPYSS